MHRGSKMFRFNVTLHTKDVKRKIEHN